MKNVLLTILLSTIACGVIKNNKGNIMTVSGEAMRSKGGLVVESVMITGMSSEYMDSLTGKYLKVTGYVENNHPWMIDESDPVIKQGFNMPAMTKVISVEILPER